jgi:hypothetical protein
VSETELAWAAGFFDGEGSTMVARCKPKAVEYYYFRLSVGQTNPETLERFQRAVGGMGAISGPRLRKDGRKPFWQWQLTGQKGIEVMEQLWPYLSEEKRNQYVRARAEIREHRLKNNLGGRDEMANFRRSDRKVLRQPTLW